MRAIIENLQTRGMSYMYQSDTINDKMNNQYLLHTTEQSDVNETKRLFVRQSNHEKKKWFIKSAFRRRWQSIRTMRTHISHFPSILNRKANRIDDDDYTNYYGHWINNNNNNHHLNVRR